MKKYETGLAPRKISMIDGPTRLGIEYASPEIQFPTERWATSRKRTGAPASFRSGQRRSTKNKLTRTTASSGRTYAAKRPLAPAPTMATRTTILTTPNAMARVARNWPRRAARIPLSVIWNHVWAVVSTTARRTSTDHCCAAALLMASTEKESTSPVTAERDPPMRRSFRIKARGRSARAMNRTSPLSSPKMPMDVAKEDRETRAAAMPNASELNSRAANAQKMKPREELAIADVRTQPPCSRTMADSSIGPVESRGSIQGNSHPSTTPTNGRNKNRRIRIPRNAAARSSRSPATPQSGLRFPRLATNFTMSARLGLGRSDGRDALLVERPDRQ